MPGTSANLSISISATGQQQAAAAVNAVTQSLQGVSPAATAASTSLANAATSAATLAPAATAAGRGLASLNTGLGPTAAGALNLAGASISLAAGLAAIPPAATGVTGGLSGIGGATQRTGKSLNDLKAQLQRFKDALGAATNPTAIDRLNRSIAATQQRITAITRLPPIVPPSTTPALNNLRNSSDRAGQALTNLGRVAQDAPFGFIGIANNLNPLLESFQRLRAESGSNGAALRALGGSLMGAGGIGLALSAVTAIVSFAQMGFRAWGASAKDAGDAVKKTKDETQAFTDSLKQAESGALATSFSLKSFVNIARDNTKSLDERNYALKEANKLLGDHGEKLTLVNINTKAVTEEVNKFTQALISQAVASKYTDKVADGFIKQANAAKEFQKAQDAFDDPKTQRSRFTNDGTFKTARKNLIETTEAYKQATKQFQQDNGDLQKAIDDSNKLFAQLGTFDKKDAKPKAEKIVKELREAIRKSFDEAPLISVTNAVKFQDAGRLYDKKEDQKDIAETVKFMREGFKAPESLGKLTIPLEFQNQINAANNRFKELKSNVDLAAAGVFTFADGSTLNAMDSVILKAELAKKAFETLATTFRSILIKAVSDGLATIGEAIGNLATGQSSGLQALFGILAEAASAFGKALIAFGVGKIVLEKFIDVGGGVAIAAGVGLVALGQILKNSVPKFAEGSIVTGPMLAQVGEAGQSEAIIPLSRLNSILGSGGGQVEVYGRLEGADILLSSKRAQGSRGRTFG